MNSLTEEKAFFCRVCKNAKNGIKIVTGRNNPFYALNADRKAVRKQWDKSLANLTNKYGKQEQTLDVFLRDVQLLKKEMNAKFPGAFARGEFHFIDALRSLSVVIKYRWCCEKDYPNYPKPPQCPITKPILDYLQSDYIYYEDKKITKQVVLKIYQRIKQEADKHESHDIAIWELYNYNELKRNQ